MGQSYLGFRMLAWPLVEEVASPGGVGQDKVTEDVLLNIVIPGLKILLDAFIK